MQEAPHPHGAHHWWLDYMGAVDGWPGWTCSQEREGLQLVTLISCRRLLCLHLAAPMGCSVATGGGRGGETCRQTADRHPR
jgi:hypothetical protein